ncbi:MAG: hypothetical protein ACOC8E_02590 [Planctomycetota bacterium]
MKLDGRIPLAAVKDATRKESIKQWIDAAASELEVDREVADSLRGAVFEVRQGYKSADSKRQNADIGNAANAYANAYLPVNMLLSAQVSETVAARYRRAQWLVLRGSTEGSSLESTYAFCSGVLGYDLAGLFRRNRNKLKNAVEEVIRELLKEA